MECLQNRIDSFTKPKRVRNPAKSYSFVSVKWSHPPHPQFIATPETLAEAGFYFNPSFEDRDNVACFVCDKQLSDWEAEDDPFDIHWAKCGDRCCWAVVRCGLRGDINRQGGFTFTDKSRIPTSKAMERARLETFSAGDGWIHDQVKNHGASSRKMARAGFVFTPQHAGDDLATCLYCNVALSGWEASDDPLEEHLKRQKVPCPIFDAGEAVTKPPSRTLSANAPSSKSQPSRHARAVSASKNTDFVLPMKTHDGDADESDIVLPSSSKRTRPLSSLNKSAKTPKISKSQSLKDVAEDDEDAETEENVPRTGRAKPKKSMGTTTKKTKSRSKSIARRATSDDEEEEVISKVPSRSRSKAKGKGKGKAAMDDDELEAEMKAPKKSTRGRPPTRAKEQEDDVQEVQALKKLTRSRAPPPRVEEPEDEPEEEQDIASLKKSTRSRVPPRVEELDYDDEDLTKTVKKPTRTKKTSHIDGITTNARKPSKTKKVKEPEPKLEPESEIETHDADMDVMDEEERKPRASSKSRAKMPAAGRPSRARPKAEPIPMQEVAPAHSSIIVQKERTASTSTRTPAANAASGTAQSLVTPAAGTSVRLTPAPHRDEDDGDADELVALPPSGTKKRVPSSSTSAKPKAPQSKAKREGNVPAPASTAPEAEATDDDDDDMDVFVSPRESPEPSARETLSPEQKDSEVKASEADNGMKALVIPKRAAKPLSSKPNGKPVQPVDKDVDMESATTGVKPQVSGKEIHPARESGTKSRKGSFLKIVEISTDEEDGASDEEQPSPQTSKPAQKTESPSIEAPSSLKSKTAVEKPVIIEPPQQLPAGPEPSPKPVPPPPSTSPAPTKPSQDVEMVVPEAETESLIETQPAEPAVEVPVVEVPVPVTPPRAATHPKLPTPEPPLFVPPLSKLPYAPLQNLTDAELDMTVEEWIRYQMEMEYDKFKRDGEREIGRFKKSAEEAKEIIERL